MRSVAREERDEPGIHVAGTRAHHEARRRREAHAGVDALPVADRGEARAAAEVREDHAAARRAVRPPCASSSSMRNAYESPWNP